MDRPRVVGVFVATLCVVGVTGASRPAVGRAASGDVAALQVAMRALGLYRASVDGVSGPQTVRAVSRFQRRHRLSADGIAGPATRRALRRRGAPALGSRPMRRGQRGWDVAALQFLLRSRGFDPGGVDGGFGAGTLRALRGFQRAAGVVADDVAGPRTLHALRTRTVSAPSTTVSGPVRFLRPVGVAFTDAFGIVGGRRHTGLDFPLAAGDPVRSAGRGTVVFAGYNRGGYGNLVVVRHRLGFETWYAHLSSLAVRAGTPVVGRTRLGGAGSTGRSTGPHLHFEVRRYGTPIDPRPRLLSTAARTSGTVSARAVRRLVCRANADVRNGRDSDPLRARYGRCP